MIKKYINKVIIDYDNKKFIIRIVIGLFLKIIEICINNMVSKITLIKQKYNSYIISYYDEISNIISWKCYIFNLTNNICKFALFNSRL